jgi:hypothetical protein
METQNNGLTRSIRWRLTPLVRWLVADRFDCIDSFGPRCGFQCPFDERWSVVLATHDDNIEVDNRRSECGVETPNSFDLDVVDVTS